MAISGPLTAEQIELLTDTANNDLEKATVAPGIVALHLGYALGRPCAWMLAGGATETLKIAFDGPGLRGMADLFSRAADALDAELVNERS